LAKSVFERGGCPTCRKSILLIDDEIILGQAMDSIFGNNVANEVLGQAELA
jgi:hypothetical protein